MKHSVTRSGRIKRGIHLIETEASTLEHALEIIELAQANARRVQSIRKNYVYKPTLTQIFGQAKGLATSLESRKRKHRVVLPHPYRDLPESEKPIKAKEMYQSGMWGINRPACRRLAKLFGVDVNVIEGWVNRGGDEWSA